LSNWIDKELRAGLLSPPDDFAARVLAALQTHPAPVAARRALRARTFIEWLALAGAVIAGLAQLLPFLFGVWTVSNAG
jgi:hypothetical protein